MCHIWRQCTYKELPVHVLVLVFLWSYVTTVRWVLVYANSYLEMVTVMGIYHVIGLMVVWCFLVSACTISKKAPAKFHMTRDAWAKMQYEFRNKPNFLEQTELDRYKTELGIRTVHSSGLPRYCQICEQLKPDRCCHCSTCKRCVLKMDHHCPWVANCVGYNNYKAFILLLSYTLVYCTFLLCIHGFLVYRIVGDLLPEQTESSSSSSSDQSLGGAVSNQTDSGDPDLMHALIDKEVLPVIPVIIVAILILFADCLLLSFHGDLLLTNKTTIEMSWAPQFPWGVDPNAYNLGKKENLLQVFGNKPLLWIFPIFTSLGDGAHFPVQKDTPGATVETASGSGRGAVGFNKTGDHRLNIIL